MQITNEAELLNISIRKQIIDEIRGSENQSRKMEAYRRYLCYRDQTDVFVKDQLLKQFDKSTVDEMSYCIANISIIRKVIDKLARVYNYGVQREVVGDDKATESMEQIAKELDFNTEIRKENKFLKLQKNSAFYVKPCPVVVDGKEKYTLRLEPLNPYLYDAVEYEYDRRRPMAFILSDFEFNQSTYTTADAATVGRSADPLEKNLPLGNGKDELIADNPDDAKTKTFIWWSENYHFTTDETGNIISESNENPIKMLPFVNFAIDQDGQFWARGGDDLIQGGILLNSVLTHNQHIATTQGYGQFWMRGKNLPRNVKIGPSKAILMEYDEGEPQPDLGFAAANPPIDQLSNLAASYCAMLLSTNNLSTSAVASQLGQSNQAPSGIAMMIDKAESREDIEDQRQIFIDNEPVIWEVIRRWLDIYGENVVDSLRGLNIPEGFELKIKFHDAPVVMSEAEKLANLKLRKELGLDRMIDLIMKDNQALTKNEAEERLKELLAEKISEPQNDQAQEDNQEPKDENNLEIEDEKVIDGNQEDESQPV